MADTSRGISAANNLAFSNNKTPNTNNKTTPQSLENTSLLSSSPRSANGSNPKPKIVAAARSGPSPKININHSMASSSSSSANGGAGLGLGSSYDSTARTDSSIGGGDANNASTSTNPNSKSNNGSMPNGSFLRHQFFRSHKAHPSSPTMVHVSPLDSSPRAANIAHRTALAKASSGLSEGGGGGATATAAVGDTKSSASAYSMRTAFIDADDTASVSTYGGADTPTIAPSAKACRSDDVDFGSDTDGSGENVITRSSRASGIRSSLQRLLTPSISGDGDVDDEVRKQSITVLPLLGLMFCNSIGGGYGLEESIYSGGALITILGVFILPLVFSLPIALVVAELATSVPTNGGFLMWINVSMSPTMYFFSVIVTLLLTFVDNALYPVLFGDYVCQWAECSDNGRKGLRLLSLVVSCILNLLGIEAVGVASIFITIISVSPFALMFVWHMAKFDGYINWDNVKTVPPNIEWVGLLSTLSWNVAGLEQAGSLAEDIQNPQRTIMLSMVPLIGLLWLSYIPPVLAGVSQTKGAEDWGLWETGYWAVIADNIGGYGFKTFLVVGSIFSSLGLCLSCLCVTSRVMAGMGEAMAFPRPISKVLFAHNKRFGTPHWSIIINTVLTGVCAVLLDFTALVTVDSALYGIRILMIFMACIKLRYAYPTLERPFKIPVSTDVLVLLLAFPIVYCVGLVVTGAFSDTESIIVFACVLIGSYGFSYLYCRYVRPHGFDGSILRVVEEELRSDASQDGEGVMEEQQRHQDDLREGEKAMGGGGEGDILIAKA